MTGMLECGQVFAARYALQRRLGSGPSGETWVARDTIANRDVALKIATAQDLDSNAAARLRQEFDALGAVAHVALLAPGRIEVADGRTFLVSDYLPGGDLSRLRGRPWPFVLRRVVPVVDALRAMHAAGWVHGDVKSSNVLLDADGRPKLADFGTARPIGSAGLADGSPYSMSPQRYAAEPAAVADDVYAVGALLYELIGGHPPFYPDVNAERVRNDVPPLLVGRPPVPDELAELVAGCLAKEAGSRPPGMTELRRRLDECLELPSASESSAGNFAGTVIQPPAEPTPIRAAWQRQSDAGPSAGELRREGFRRGVLVSGSVLAIAAVVFVFFVLPGLVESPGKPAKLTPAAVDTPAAASAAEPVAEDLEQLAELKRQAEGLRAPLDARLKSLQGRDAAAWAAADLAEARAKVAAADASMVARDFAAAIRNLQVAGQVVGKLEVQAPQVTKRLVGEGGTALDDGRSLDAQQKFAAAQRVDPANAAAAAGLKRALVLDEVLKEIGAASRLEQAGDNGAAIAGYRRALALDPATRGAREGIERLQARAGQEAFSAAMAQGLGAVARKDYRAARQAFETAARLRPGAPEVAEGLRQVDQASRTRDISAMLAAARAAEQEERWSTALETYREALRSDPALIAGLEGVDRCELRAMLDAQLQSFVDHPERLFSQDGRGVARSVLGRGAQVVQPGPRFKGQVARVSQLVQQAETPIRVALTSDNATDVQIYRVGRLGVFDQRDLELLPGRYTVVGTRNGFRDVRKEFSLLPGAPAPVLVVRCEDPI